MQKLFKKYGIKHVTKHRILFEELLFCYCALFKRGHVITEFSQRMAPVFPLSVMSQRF